MNKFNLPNLGFGLGLRAKHIPHILENKTNIDWFEIISENYMDNHGTARQNICEIREKYPLVMHGVSLSIGSSDPLNKTYLQRLKNLADDIQPAWVSDHLCWTGINGKNTHDLLPVPLTEEALNHVIERVTQVQDFLGRRILLENPSSYLTFTADHIPEYEFMAKLAQKADCGLLLDVNNIYVASFNQRLDARKYIDAIPMEHVVQIHLAGHSNKGTHIIDTHDAHVVDEVWDLYKYAIQRAGFVPSTMVEWDAKIPEFDVLEAELDKARAFANDNVSNKANAAVLSHNKPQATNHNIHSLQTNLQSAILSGDIKAAQPDTWIVAKENFSPAQQLAVYTEGYHLRLYDNILDDYEVTADILGSKMPNLINQYIKTTPSEFYNAGNFSAQFCSWLQVQNIQQPAKEMALLEHAIATCFILPESEPLTQKHLENISPEAFVELQLQLRTASMLVAFDYDVHSYMREYYKKSKRKTIQQKTYLLVYRNDSQVYRLPLEAAEFELLQLLQSGSKIGEAFEAMESKISAEKIQQYFGKWIQNGVLKNL